MCGSNAPWLRCIDTPERQTNAEMFGEFLREGGVLILVFGFLDKLVERTEKPDEPHLTWPWIVGVLAVGVGFLLGGMFVERKRRV